MKAALYVAGALILVAVGAHFLLSDIGYVGLRYGDQQVELSILAVVLLLVAGYFLVRLLLQLFQARSTWQRSQDLRRRERARRSLSKGLLELAEGSWANAEHTLTRYAHHGDEPLVHYLAAARAAELQGAEDRRDEWLMRALDCAPDHRAPVLIMQAELYLKHKRLPEALVALELLDASDEQNARGLMLLARAYRQNGDWQKLQALEPRLRAMRGVTAAHADETVVQMHLDRLKAAGQARDAAALRAAWKDISKPLTQRPEIVIAYARAAQTCGEADQAEATLRDCINRRWDDAAVLAYGELITSDPLKTLERAEGWLPARAEDATLLLTCAQLAARAELYGKARTYLESSIAIRPRLDAYQLLANLLEQLGDRDRALQALNDALTMAVGKRATLPKIRARRWHERRQRDRRRN